MFLTKVEAISLILNFSKDKSVSSKTKLNKLLARLNLFMIPVDIDFNLSKYGSYCSDIEFETTPFYEPYSYRWKGSVSTGLKLCAQGKTLAESIIDSKIKKILTNEDIINLQKTIYSLSELSASQISEEEHKDLLVDEEDKHKLVQRINSTHIDLLDLYNETKKLADEPSNVRFLALIEYCFFLTKYLKEKRFKLIEEAGYDYEANMFDYYFLYVLEKTVIPFLQLQIKQTNKNIIQINKYYQYFVNFARSRYPFSIDNPDLKELTM